MDAKTFQQCVKVWPVEGTSLVLCKQKEKLKDHQSKWSELFVPLVRELTNIDCLNAESHRQKASTEILRFSCPAHKSYFQIEARTATIQKDKDTEWNIIKPRMVCGCCK